MSPNNSERLAAEIQAGAYVLGSLEGCDGSLPHDRNSHVIRYTQFALFANPKPRPFSAPEYAIVQPHLLFSSEATAERTATRVLQKLAEEVATDLPTQALPPPSLREIEEIRSALASVAADVDDAESAPESGSPAQVARRDRLPTATLPDIELLDEYEAWLLARNEDALNDRFGALYSSGVAPLPLAPIGISGDLKELIAGLGDALFPGPYQPFETLFPHLALAVTYEQTWEPCGYTRGELINTIALAPGEQLTLEVHSWDKTVSKTEQELATETEFRSTFKSTQRDALTVAQEFSQQRTTHVGADTTIPIPGMSVGVSGNLDTTTQKTIRRSQESLSEQTRDASETVRVNRKLRIEVSREVGRETKRTHVIQNTNRCHTLNCHYFEVLANYLVTTRVSSVRPCVLLANSRPIFSLDWIVCHEHLVRRSLLDETYSSGLVAAKTLKKFDAWRSLADGRAISRAKGEAADADSFRTHATAIATKTSALREASGQAVKQLVLCYSQVLGWSQMVAYALVRIPARLIRSLLYWSALPNTAKDALERFEEDRANFVADDQALQTLFASIEMGQFEPRREPALLAAALKERGLPWLLARFVAMPAILELGPDDGGLVHDLKGALQKLKGTVPGPTDVPGLAVLSPTEEPFAAADIAAAQVDFDQLRCHLEENWRHYAQAVWRAEDSGERFLRLQSYGGVARIIGDEIVGFHANKSAHPITNLAAVRRWVDFEKVLTAADTDGSMAPTFLATVPTGGSVLEAMVGECDACEDFIQDSRLIDLRLQGAKARSAEEEARRHRMRLDADPPDLSDPTPKTPAPITVQISAENNDTDDSA